jgi:hypothetical protein
MVRLTLAVSILLDGDLHFKTSSLEQTSLSYYMIFTSRGTNMNNVTCGAVNISLPIIFALGLHTPALIQSRWL